MLGLGDHSSRSGPGGRLLREAAIADQRRVARSAARSVEQVLDRAQQCYQVFEVPFNNGCEAAFVLWRVGWFAASAPTRCGCSSG